MKINEARIKSLVSPINKLLESRFGLTVELANATHLAFVKEHYADKRRGILSALGESAAFANADYAKCVLIIEAATIMLREIAPKRMKRKSKQKS